MAFHLIASHLQAEREAQLEQRRLERLVRNDPARFSAVDRARLALARRVIALGRALGGRAMTVPAGRHAAHPRPS